MGLLRDLSSNKVPPRRKSAGSTRRRRLSPQEGETRQPSQPRKRLPDEVYHTLPRTQHAVNRNDSGPATSPPSPLRAQGGRGLCVRPRKQLGVVPKSAFDVFSRLSVMTWKPHANREIRSLRCQKLDGWHTPLMKLSRCLENWRLSPRPDGFFNRRYEVYAPALTAGSEFSIVRLERSFP